MADDLGFDDKAIDPGIDMTTAAAMHANAAAHNANQCAIYTHDLSCWVNHLWIQDQELRRKVSELEDWKKKALEDMRRLREEHKALRKRYGVDEPEPPKPARVEKPAEMPPPPVGLPLECPPGPPPGLEKTPVDEALVKTFSLTSVDFPVPEGLTRTETACYVTDQADGVRVKQITVDGSPAERAEWRIPQLSQKLRGCMGRNLVSGPFAALGMQDLRLMLCPDSDAQKEKGSKKEKQSEKERYDKKVREGPLDGSLKLKVPASQPQKLKYYFTLGTRRKGPMEHDFGARCTSEPENFLEDWLQETDKDGGLMVTVEIIQPSEA